MNRTQPSQRIDRIIARLRAEAAGWAVTTLDAEAERSRDPFRVLVATILSQRTLDRHTEEAARRLFARARSPRSLTRLSEAEIAELIRPAGFFRTKARTLRRLGEDLLVRFGGRVPSDMEGLLSLPGVGRKTANLVLTHGFGLPGICVDVHVHRIMNRTGYVRTAEPDETEMALRRRLPRAHWRGINGLLVAFGQNVCRPLSPHCSRCPIRGDCRRIGVEASR
jgi:endonuclease III